MDRRTPTPSRHWWTGGPTGLQTLNGLAQHRWWCPWCGRTTHTYNGQPPPYDWDHRCSQIRLHLIGYPRPPAKDLL